MTYIYKIFMKMFQRGGENKIPPIMADIIFYIPFRHSFRWRVEAWCKASQNYIQLSQPKWPPSPKYHGSWVYKKNCWLIIFKMWDVFFFKKKKKSLKRYVGECKITLVDLICLPNIHQSYLAQNTSAKKIFWNSCPLFVKIRRRKK